MKKIKKFFTKENKLWQKKGLLIASAFVLVLVVFAVLNVILVQRVVKDAKLSMQLGREAYAAVKEQNLVEANDKLKQTKKQLKQTDQSLKTLGYVKYIPFVKNYYLDGVNGIQAGLQGVEAGIVLTEALNPYADVLGFKGEGSFTGGSVEERLIKIVETMGEISPQIDTAVEELSKAEEKLAQIDPNRYPEEFRGYKVREKLTAAEENFTETVEYLKNFQPLFHTLPKMLGHPEPRKYLVIFQNDGELRPTGGFMTAYTIMEAKSGKISAQGSNDIYHLDEKYNSDVDAPAPIERYLLSADLNVGIVPKWYLRDMNLSPDFKVSMDTFSKYFAEVPGEPEIDGIIALDTEVLKDLVTLLGPLDVPGFGKFTMDPDERCHGIPNVICELEYIVDTPIPGIKVDRKGVLGPMMQTIMQKAFSAPKSIWPALFKISMENIQEKHLLLYLNNEKEQQAAEEINAAGRIMDYQGDYLHINNSNFGGAKSNLFVEQEVEQEIKVKDNGNLEKTLTITYTNPEPMDNCNLERKSGLCLNGVLRDYFRVYVPQGSELIEVLGSETEPQAYESLGKQVFEGFFTLRGGGGRAKVIVKYEVPRDAVKTDDYQLLIQKQPGTKPHDYTVIYDGKEKKEFKLDQDTELEFEN